MRGHRLAGVLWLIAGLSSGLIAFFVVDPVTLAVFIVGAATGALLGLAMLVRPSPGYGGLSALLAVGWLIAFGAVTIGNLAAPIEELLSVIWVLAFGLIAGIAAYARRGAAAMG